jgi:quercetin dioxygenase-like cupin family protein
MRAPVTASPQTVDRAFAEDGYVAPVPLFTPEECGRMLVSLEAAQKGATPLAWSKGWAATSPEFFSLASNDRILDVVTSLLGEDVLVWSARLIQARPGYVHPWHTDIESSAPTAESVAVWIGLADARGAMRVVSRSHRFGVPVQQVMHEGGVSRESVTDDYVVAWARERDERSGVVRIDAAEGEALLFDGRLWHAAGDLGRQARRYTVLLQYATPATAIRIPNPARMAWPFEFQDEPRPPCVVVSGEDTHGVNRIVRPPAAPRRDGRAPLTSQIHALRLPLEQDPATGWKPHPLFRGSTAAVADMGCHVSILDPGREPHPPHRHDEEEILLVLDGEAELVVESTTSQEGYARQRAERGTFAYYPAHFAHTLHNTGGAPVTYVMFKWTTDRNDDGAILGHRLVPLDQVPDVDGTQFSKRPVLGGATRYLRHLHAHVTSLAPGAGYEPHADPYDVGIVVLEGTVQTLDKSVGANGVVFYAAGERHGMRNVGDAPAVYVVFEFHGRRTLAHPPPGASGGMARRLVRALRTRAAAVRRRYLFAVPRAARKCLRLGRFRPRRRRRD